MDIIEELFFGRIYPSDQSRPDTKEYGEAMKQVVETNDKLLEMLTPEQEKCLEDYKSAAGSANAMVELEIFRQGFQLGAQLYQEMRLQSSSCKLILETEKDDKG